MIDEKSGVINQKKNGNKREDISIAITRLRNIFFLERAIINPATTTIRPERRKITKFVRGITRNRIKLSPRSENKKLVKGKMIELTNIVPPTITIVPLTIGCNLLNDFMIKLVFHILNLNVK